MSINAAIYNALRDGSKTEAQLRKASKAEDDEFDNALSEWRSRLWLSADESGKTPKFSLTDQGRNDMSVRYPDS